MLKELLTINEFTYLLIILNLILYSISFAKQRKTLNEARLITQNPELIPNYQAHRTKWIYNLLTLIMMILTLGHL